jgi:hypothetical protein
MELYLYNGETFFGPIYISSFSIGIVVYFWNISLLNWIILHTIFELLENTKIGMRLINNFPYWPGGKPTNDSMINSLGDTIGSILGWISAYLLDNIGNKYGWYTLHNK